MIAHLNKCTADWDKCTKRVCFNHCIVTQLNKHTCTIQCLIECSKYIYFSDCTIAYSSKVTEFTLVSWSLYTYTSFKYFTNFDRSQITHIFLNNLNKVCFISQNLLLMDLNKFLIWLLAPQGKKINFITLNVPFS